MDTFKLKTTINCSSCVATVTPILNMLDNIDEWHVDTSTDDKILTVELDDSDIQSVINALSEAGYKAEPI